MTIKNYLRYITLSTLLCGAAWVAVLTQMSPLTSGGLGLALFILTLFLFLVSLFSLMGFGLRRKVFESGVEFRQVEVAFHQAVVLAALFVVLLLVKSQGWLNLYSAFLLVAVAVALEFFWHRSLRR